MLLLLNFRRTFGSLMRTRQLPHFEGNFLNIKTVPFLVILDTMKDLTFTPIMTRRLNVYVSELILISNVGLCWLWWLWFPVKDYPDKYSGKIFVGLNGTWRFSGPWYCRVTNQEGFFIFVVYLKIDSLFEFLFFCTYEKFVYHC